MPRRSAPRHAAPRHAAARHHGQYPPAAPRPAADSVPARFRGAGRPSLLTYAAAAALLAAGGLAVGVTAGPTAAADAIGGHARLASSAAPGHAFGAAGPASLTRSPAATGLVYPVASQSAASRADSRDQAGRRTRGGEPSGGARPSGTALPQHSQPSAAPSPSASAAAEQPIEIYDSATPAAIPAGVMAAAYATGHYAAPAAEMAGRPTIWIDAWGTDPAASVLDVEPGDATPSMVPGWITEHLKLEPSDNARIYTMLDEWAAVQQAVSGLPSWMQARIRWWIADPTGVPHMVPGASATQWYWGPSYDISTADPGF